jgi:hypothetical protein
VLVDRKKNVDIAERATKAILKIDETNEVAHVLIANIYAETEGKEKSSAIWNSMKDSVYTKHLESQLVS